MITSIDNALAQQIVNTVKDICGYDINFIRPSGMIFASTDPGRIGTYHEIGKQAAAFGTTVEVQKNDDISGIRQGINLPIYHNGRLLAVIGITGTPEEVRKYAHLAERITRLLIRERELNSQNRSQADKKNFVVTALMQKDISDEEYLTDCLKDFHIDMNSPKRFLIIRIDSHYNPVNLSILEQKICDLFSQTGIILYTFRYPKEFFAVIDEVNFQKNCPVFRSFAGYFKKILQISAGKTCTLFHLHSSYNSALTALKSLPIRGENYVVFDDLSLENILSFADNTAREEFLKKTISTLQPDDLELLKTYFSEDMSLTNTCKKLYLHKNTLQYKLNHIFRKCGFNPRRFRDAVFLYLALKIQEL